MSKELDRRGAVVYVTALIEEEAQLVVDEISAQGNQTVATNLDVTHIAEFFR